jgi:hypothetical protein
MQRMLQPKTLFCSSALVPLVVFCQVTKAKGHIPDVQMLKGAFAFG